jgi:hypothetical protein
LEQIAKVVEIDVGFVKHHDFAGLDRSAEFACALVVVFASGINDS